MRNIYNTKPVIRHLEVNMLLENEQQKIKLV